MGHLGSTSMPDIPGRLGEIPDRLGAGISLRLVCKILSSGKDLSFKKLTMQFQVNLKIII